MPGWFLLTGRREVISWAIVFHGWHDSCIGEMAGLAVKVIAVAGSHRRNGNTELALGIMAAKLAEVGVETEILPLAGKNIEPCRACDRCKQVRQCLISDDLVEVMEKMAAADGIILASPVYSFNITPVMHNLLVRGNRYFHILAAPEPAKEDVFSYANVPSSILRGKVGAAVTVARRAGGGAALAGLYNFMLVNEMYVVGSCYETTLFGYNRGEITQDGEGINNLRRLAENMGVLLQKLG